MAELRLAACLVRLEEEEAGESGLGGQEGEGRLGRGADALRPLALVLTGTIDAVEQLRRGCLVGICEIVWVLRDVVHVSA